MPGAGGPVRVALLPPLVWLIAAVVAAIAIGAWLSRDRRDADAALPLFALGVLVLPAFVVARSAADSQSRRRPGPHVMWLIVLWLTVARAAMGRVPTGGGASIFLISALLFGARWPWLVGAGHRRAATNRTTRDHAKPAQRSRSQDRTTTSAIIASISAGRCAPTPSRAVSTADLLRILSACLCWRFRHLCSAAIPA